MNFYQSSLWRHINEYIYEKPLFTLEILGKQYFGVIKRQKKLGKTFSWYMVHGIHRGDIHQYNSVIVDNLYALKRDFAQQRGDIFFQLGSVDEISRIPTIDAKEGLVADHIVQQKKYIRSHFWERYNLQPSRREHMPDTTIIIDLSKPLTELKSDFSRSGKRYYNKATRQELLFTQATEQDRSTFWQMRYAMAYDKGFAVVPEKQFLALMKYLTTTHQGTLLLAKKDGAIVSGNVLLFLDKQLIYLYGATDRSYGNIGAHYRLMYETMKRGRTHTYTSLDLLGIAPVGDEDNHYLTGVTRFKQAFGGTTISYIGNYDLIFNAMLYKAMKVTRR